MKASGVSIIIVCATILNLLKTKQNKISLEFDGTWRMFMCDCVVFLRQFTLAMLLSTQECKLYLLSQYENKLDWAGGGGSNLLASHLCKSHNMPSHFMLKKLVMSKITSSLHMSQVAHKAGAYPSFCSMKWLGVFLLPPGWDASPSHAYLQHFIFASTSLYT